MAIAALSSCTELGVPFFYLNIDTSVADIWQPDEKGSFSSRRPEKVTMTLRADKLAAYLAGHGFEVESMDLKRTEMNEQEQQFLSRALIGNMSDGIAALNHAATAARGSPDLTSDDVQATPALNVILDSLVENGWVKILPALDKKTDIRIRFCDENTRSFLNGRWLEDYAGMVLHQCLPPNTQVANVRVRNDRSGRPNELDILFIQGHSLHVVEVKTLRWNDDDNSKQDTIHKLLSLKGQLGGLTAKGCLVSYQKLTSDVRSRALAANIFVIEGAALHPESNFKGKFKEWLRQ